MKKRCFIFGIKMCALLLLILGVASHFDKAHGAEESEGKDVLPELFIAAINPGYKIDGISNVGEMIEIGRRDLSDDSIPLAGITVGYTNSSGAQSILIEFPESSWMTGERTLFRLAGLSGHELAARTYSVKGSSAGIAQSAGPLTIMRNGEVLDSVCWTGLEGCQRKFKSGSNESLIRNLETGEWEYKVDYEPIYDANSYHEIFSDGEEGEVEVEPQCRKLRFSEILSYYDTSRAEQFIELYNSGSEQVLLNGCKIRYKNKDYVLDGIVKPEEYFVFYPEAFSLTKNPANYNRLELIDVDDKTVDVLDYPNGQRKGTSYMFLGYDDGGEEIWKVSYAPTPGDPNNYQEYKTCEEGKVINEATGNCVKVTSISEKICGEGYYLNLLTGRCRKMETTTTQTCKEGYYLNPETNRCRKIRENDGAAYEITPEQYEEKSSFVALYVVLVILGIGGIYLIYEFRHEIRRLCGRVFRVFH